MHYLTRLAILLSTFSFLVLNGSGVNGADAVKVVMGGKTVQFKPPPLRLGDDLYVPVSVLDALGARVTNVHELGTDSEKLTIINSEGRRFEAKARLVDGQKMLPIREIAEELGARVRLDNQTGILSLRALIRSINFDGSKLEVVLSYPTTYSAVRWTSARKFILDIYGVEMPSTPDKLIRNTSSAAIRTGTRDNGETARIVLDLPKLTSHHVESSPKTSRIVVTISPFVRENATVSDTANASSLVPSGRVASAGQATSSDIASVEEEKQKEPPASSEADIGVAPRAPIRLPQSLAHVTDVVCRAVDEDSFVIEVHTDKPVSCQTWMYRNPDRVYLDLNNTVLSKEFGNLMQDHHLVLGVRPMQQNNTLVRIAVDLSRVAAPVLRQENSPCRLIMSLEVPKASGGSLASKVIVIDPGHGGNGSAGRGAVGCKGTLEKVVNLQIAERVDRLLREEGACSIMTRRDNNTYVEVNARPLFAKRHSADIFLSIHSNSCGKLNSMSGTETYFHRWEPSSRALATCIHSEVVAVTGLPDNGTRSDLRLYKNGLGVLRGATAYGIPAALLEVAYINHEGDEKLLNDPDFQERVAQAIVRGLKAYVEGSPQGIARDATKTSKVLPDRSSVQRKEKGS